MIGIIYNSFHLIQLNGLVIAIKGLKCYYKPNYPIISMPFINILLHFNVKMSMNVHKKLYLTVCFLLIFFQVIPEFCFFPYFITLDANWIKNRISPDVVTRAKRIKVTKKMHSSLKEKKNWFRRKKHCIDFSSKMFKLWQVLKK